MGAPLCTLCKRPPPRIVRATSRVVPSLVPAASSALRCASLLPTRLRVHRSSGRAVRLQCSPRAEANNVVADDEKSITKVSFGTIGLSVGSVLLVGGFLGYFNFIPNADNSLSALLLIYGFPISLIGFALKYAELQPLVCESYADAVALRETQATPILQQIRSDVTRYRYGDEQHLEEALDRIFRVAKSGGIRRNQSPKLMRLREEVVGGRYALVLGFDSPNLPFEEWETRQPKIQSFFGPGVSALVVKDGESNVSVSLVSDGTVAGGVAPDEEVLIPLLPGLPPRVVKKKAQ